MTRIAALTLTLLALAPLTPIGCPPSDTGGDDGTLSERSTLPTTATAPERAGVGDTVQLQAQVSGATGAVRYAWFQISGSGVAITAANQASASFIAPSLPTEQRIELAVTTHDEAGAVGRAVVGVTISADPGYVEGGNGVPGGARAVAGTDQSVAGGSSVTLDGSKSAGTSLKFRWRQVSGPTVTLTGATTVQAKFVAPQFSASGENTMTFELTVTDSQNRTLTDRINITVKDPNASNPRVTIATSLGDIVVELNNDKAPITVRNFLRYVDDTFYDGTIVHRVVKDFVIQGGGFTADLEEKDTRNPIANEADNGLSNVRGAIAMARLTDPNTATSQFYINVKNNIKDGDGKADLDPGGVDEFGYAVFGKVITGMDIVDKIAAVETGTRKGFSDVPITNVVIRSIRRVATSGGSSPGSFSGGASETERGDESVNGLTQ